MSDRVKFYFDEHVPGAVAAGLAARGIDVLTAHGAGRAGQPDDAQLRFATTDGRVVVTQDTDYLVLTSRFLAAGETFAGVAYSHQSRFYRNVGGFVRRLTKLHTDLSADDMRNHVEYL